MPAAIYSPEGDCMGYEKLSTITAATSFTATEYTYKGKIAQAALITVETAAIRFTMDGTTPVVTGGTEAGHKIDAGQSFVVRGYKSISQFKCINETAGNGAKAFVSFYFLP